MGAKEVRGTLPAVVRHSCLFLTDVIPVLRLWSTQQTRDLTFWRRWLWRCLSSGMWQCVIW